MPCISCSNGKYKFGESGTCRYNTLAECERANAGRNSKHTPGKRKLKKRKKGSRRGVYGALKKKLSEGQDS